MMNYFKKMLVALIVSMSVLIPMSASAQASQIEFILDWVPNTNHTGLYVALEKGYFEEVGVEVTIRRPPEGSTTELVGLGQAQFGISFQDSLATRLAGGLPVTAVATIIEHNTSGIIAREDSQITKPVEMEGHTYGTWNDPIELGMLEHIINNEGGDYSQIELVPNQADNSIVGLANSMFESAWVYYAWDGIMAESQGVPTNFFYFRDYAEELDFYSPIIIANNDYLANSPEEATQVVQAIKRGYQYAIENPEEATDILLKHAPELEGQRDFVLASQEWINDAYTSKPEQWGYIDEERWNAFYTWLYESNLTEVDLTQESYFTNEFLGE